MRRQANNVERGREKVSGTFSGRRCANCRRGIAEKVPGTFFRGLTLIELLVTIVIMVTVLGAVIPIISPNNNQRKIREAARQLNSLIQQAQAQAARDGRPAGIGFRELNTSGIALEAYIIAEPPPFAGFSPNSRVEITPAPGGIVYGDIPGGNGGELYMPQYTGAAIYRLMFVTIGGVDSFPPKMLRMGDTIEVAGNQFLVIDDEDPYGMPNALEEDGENRDTGYLLSDITQQTAPIPGTTLDCVWINNSGQALSMSPPGGGAPILRPYRIFRQPESTSDQPMQFPRGIGIDLQGSHASGQLLPDDFDTRGPTTVGIMFQPDGSLEGIYLENNRYERVSQVFMLLGLFENGNDGTTTGTPSEWELNFDFIANPVTAGDRDALAQRRSRINWLHSDARWVALNRAGRTAVTENYASFDPSQSPYIDDITGTTREITQEQQRRQIRGVFSSGGTIVMGDPPPSATLVAPGARSYAAQMQSEGGR